MGQLLVRADASSQIGAGHVMRCLALSKAWQSVGGRVFFAAVEMAPMLSQRLQDDGISVLTVEGPPGSQDDVKSAKEHARRLGAEWMVVDGYRFGPEYHREVKGKNLLSLAIDDDGRFQEYCADVVLNQNASASEAMYPKRTSYTRLLLGSYFTLLRPEFVAAQREHKHPLVGKNILVTMGGSDPENVTLEVMEALAEIPVDERQLCVVVGSGNPHIAGLREAANRLGDNVVVEENPPNMARLMAWADLAVSAAGSTCWELAYMGVPAVVMAISRDHVGIAQAVAERRIGCNLGWHSEVSKDSIREAVCTLLTDSIRRKAMSEAGQGLVDGRGASRVVEFMRSVA